MSVHIDVAYEGDLQCSAVHRPTGQRLATDAPADNHGKARTFSPTDLVAVALGTCLTTIMAVVAQEKGIVFERAKVSVEKEMTPARPRRIARLAVHVTLSAKHEARERAVLEQAARDCPVSRSLHPDTKVELQFHYE